MCNSLLKILLHRGGIIDDRLPFALTYCRKRSTTLLPAAHCVIGKVSPDSYLHDYDVQLFENQRIRSFHGRQDDGFDFFQNWTGRLNQVTGTPTHQREHQREDFTKSNSNNFPAMVRKDFVHCHKHQDIEIIICSQIQSSRHLHNAAWGLMMYCCLSIIYLVVSKSQTKKKRLSGDTAARADQTRIWVHDGSSFREVCWKILAGGCCALAHGREQRRGDGI